MCISFLLCDSYPYLPQEPSQNTCLLQRGLPVSQGSTFYRNSHFPQISGFQRGDCYSSFVPLIAEAGLRLRQICPTVFTCESWVQLLLFIASSVHSGLILPWFKLTFLDLQMASFAFMRSSMILLCRCWNTCDCHFKFAHAMKITCV